MWPVWKHFWHNFETILGTFETISGSFWDNFGIILWSFWDHVGTNLKYFGDDFQIILKPYTAIHLFEFCAPTRLSSYSYEVPNILLMSWSPISLVKDKASGWRRWIIWPEKIDHLVEEDESSGWNTLRIHRSSAWSRAHLKWGNDGRRSNNDGRRSDNAGRRSNNGLIK